MGKKVVHGSGHDWKLVGDIVERRQGSGRVISFERWWRCGDCPSFERHRTFTLTPRYERGPLSYKGTPVPVEDRVTVESEGVADILNTTKNDEIKSTLRALGY